MLDRALTDDKDREILREMNLLKTNNLSKIGDRVGLSKSAVQKRIKRLAKDGVLKGFIPQLDKDTIPGAITAISLIRAKYRDRYAKEAGAQLAKVEGVCAVYFVLGDNDFVVILKGKNIQELNEIVNKFASIGSIERSSTIMSLSTEYEDISKFVSL